MPNELAFVTFPSSFSTLLPSFLLHHFLRGLSIPSLSLVLFARCRSRIEAMLDVAQGHLFGTVFEAILYGSCRSLFC